MHEPYSAASADGTPRWGYERPDCRGDKALAFFLDDLNAVIERHARDAHTPESMADAQRDADSLLAGYRAIASTQGLFDGASVTLHHARGEHGRAQLFPVFSPALKQRLVDLLARSGHAV